MQVNTTEINGFEIDKFNQYDLKVGKTQGICPLCSHKRKQANKNKACASYDWKRGIGTCMNCNSTFQLHTFAKRGSSIKEYVRPSLPSEGSENLDEKIVQWFADRGISLSTLEDFGVTQGMEYMPQVNAERNTIQFNYYRGGELVNVKYRDAEKNFKLYKGAEKIFYNIDVLDDHNEVVVVEGEIDALSLHEAGIKNVISVPNGATLHTNNLDYLDSCWEDFELLDRVILAVDNDDAGKALRAEFIRRLGAEKCYIVDFESYKDANEVLALHGAEKLKSYIHSCQQVPLDGVSTIADVEAEVVDFVNNGFKPGYQIGLEDFDNIFSTYTGQFITVTGIPSSGKSDFVDQMSVGYNINYGWKVAYASPENKPNWLHAHKLMRKVWGKMPTKEDIKTPEWDRIVNHVNDNFYFVDMDRYDLESVLKKGAELVKRKGIKCLIIDPFNKIRDTNTEREDVNHYTMEYLTKIEMFCKKYDVLVIVVAHPTKMYKNQQGEIEEPTMYNIKGGGEWYDASYHGLLVHRDYNANTVKVKVLKVKFQHLGENGAEAHFRWEPNSGRFIPLATPKTDGLPWENG